ncbi:hypothetical protein Bbelb_280450 [Branchiostoma belcheri]|nr:hypothetical protein Bbelb_280450 [Branchiostoma belcheri]
MSRWGGVGTPPGSGRETRPSLASLTSLKNSIPGGTSWDDLLPREFLPRREGFALLLLASLTEKDNADAQQDCEGGYAEQYVADFAEPTTANLPPNHGWEEFGIGYVRQGFDKKARQEETDDIVRCSSHVNGSSPGAYGSLV